MLPITGIWAMCSANAWAPVSLGDHHRDVTVTAELAEQVMRVPQRQVGVGRPWQRGVRSEQRTPLGPGAGSLSGRAQEAECLLDDRRVNRLKGPAEHSVDLAAVRRARPPVWSTPTPTGSLGRSLPD